MAQIQFKGILSVLKSNGELLLQIYATLLDKYKYSSPKMQYEYNPFLFTADYIDKKVAQNLAEEVFDVIHRLIEEAKGSPYENE